MWATRREWAKKVRLLRSPAREKLAKVESKSASICNNQFTSISNMFKTEESVRSRALKEKLRGYWKLFIVFFRIGLFTFGGGFAMLPLIEKEVVDVHGWATREEIVDIFALAQSVPGAIAVNTAVFIGLRLYGLLGAIAALLGVVSPSIAIILIIAQLFSQFQSNLYVARAFSGVKAAVLGLIAAATLRAGRSAIVDRFGLLVAASALALSVSGVIPVVWVILLGGLSGILYHRRRGEEQ